MKAYYLERKGLHYRAQLGNLPKPSPRENEVLVKVHHTSVNPVEWQHIPRVNLLPLQKLVLGRDVAGTVASVGMKAHRLLPGDSVYAMAPILGGCFAEYVRLPEHLVVKLPANLDFAQAGGVPLAAVTAWQALKVARLQAGARVLIYGAPAGIAPFAIQLAKALDTESAVIDEALTAPGAEQLLALGAGQAWAGLRNAERAGKQAFDAVIDFSSGKHRSVLQRLLAGDGTFVSTRPARTGPWDLWVTSRKRSQQQNRYFTPHPQAMDLQEIGEFIQQGKLRTLIDRTFPLDHIADAHRWGEQHHCQGKIIIATAAGLAP